MIYLIGASIIIILFLTDKSDLKKMRECEKMPPFSKKEASYYLNEYIYKTKKTK